MLITVETPIPDTPRVQQVRGMFDLPADKTSRPESYPQREAVLYALKALQAR